MLKPTKRLERNIEISERTTEASSRGPTRFPDLLRRRFNKNALLPFSESSGLII
jgi:hypothetical protein